MDMRTWTLVDKIVLAYLALGTVLGFRRGLSGEITRLVSLTITGVVALALYRPAGVWIVAHTRLEEGVARALAFGLRVAGVGAAMLVFRLLLKPLIQRAFSETTDRAGGMIAGFLGSVMAVILVFSAAAIWPHPYVNRQFGEVSLVGRWIHRYLAPVRECIETLPFTDAGREQVKTSSETGSDPRHAMDGRRAPGLDRRQWRAAK